MTVGRAAPLDSPYQPGFGARPAVLAGRESHLARAAATLTKVANSRSSSSSSLVLTGARGLGKTVTLGAIADDARSRGFIPVTATFDSVSDNVQLLASRIAEAIAPLDTRKSASLWTRLRGRLGELSIEINTGIVKVAASTSGTDAKESGRQKATERQALEALITGTAELLSAHEHAGLVLLVDELQEAPHSQLVVIANAFQGALAAGEGAPLAIFAAGLPNTPDVVMAAASFAERFDYRDLGRLDDGAAARALLEPSLQLGVHWSETAAAAVLKEAGGSPYLIQYIGDETWIRAAPITGERIEYAHTAAAMQDVRRSLATGMFRGRWNKATTTERLLLVAMAQVIAPDGVATSRHITALLNKTTPQLSTARKALIDKGIIESAGTGKLRFTMQGFAEFVRDHVDAPWYGDRLAAGDQVDLRAANPPELPSSPEA